jgi:hypothetical protein
VHVRPWKSIIRNILNLRYGLVEKTVMRRSKPQSMSLVAEGNS